MQIPNFLNPEPSEKLGRPIVKVVPLPFERSTSYKRGTENAPEAILHASTELEFYDFALDHAPCDVFDIQTDFSLVDSLRKIPMKEALTAIEEKAADIFTASQRPLFLGGEHTITLPVVRALAEQPVTVVQIDAHADLRDGYLGESICHASVFYHACEILPIVQIGVRAICKQEREFMQHRNVTTIGMHEMSDCRWMERALSAIKTDKVYLSFDLDGLDPSIMPATGTPVPGGLQWQESMIFLKKLFENKRVIGADIVELCPQKELFSSDFVAAQLAYKMIGFGFRN